MICPICDKEIVAGSDVFMLGVDRPYMNVWMHKDCWRVMRSNYNTWVPENIGKMWEIYKTYGKDSNFYSK